MLPSLRNTSMTAAAIVALAALALGASPTIATAQDHTSPPPEFKKVSSLVELPEFVPGLGVLFVNPETLPAGPFLAYDRDGSLLSTIYMIPLAAMNDHEAFNGLGAAPNRVDHVDINFNAGHPGIPEPHYHVVLWHVSERRAASIGR